MEFTIETVRNAVLSFVSNCGSVVERVELPVGTALDLSAYVTEREGYDFTGWYSDYDLTRPWDFNAPVTADMTLYAAWQPLPAAAPSAGPWAWLIVGASISALTVLALRRRRRS